jgi:Flp pilus assembly protein TadD
MWLLFLGGVGLALAVAIAMWLQNRSRAVHEKAGGQQAGPMSSTAAPANSSAAIASSKPAPTEDSLDGPVTETQRRAPTCEELLRSQDIMPALPQAQSPYLLGKQLTMKRKFTRALRVYCVATKAQPTHAGLRAGMLELLLILRDPEAAVRHGRAGVQQFPNSSRIHNLLGDALACTKDWEGARQAWLKATRLLGYKGYVGRLAIRQMNAARDARRKHQLYSAERGFRRAAVLDPRNVEALTGLSQVLLILKDARPAASWARRAVARAPIVPAQHLLLGRALAEAGDLVGARAAWREALRLNPGSQEARRFLAEAGRATE